MSRTAQPCDHHWRTGTVAGLYSTRAIAASNRAAARKPQPFFLNSIEYSPMICSLERVAGKSLKD